MGSAPILDQDLQAMSRDQLIDEVKRLREGIRGHRDASGHDLCWHHPQLWGLLPEKTDPLPVVPPWPEFLTGCLRYRKSLEGAFPERVTSVGPYQGETNKSQSQRVREKS